MKTVLIVLVYMVAFITGNQVGWYDSFDACHGHAAFVFMQSSWRCPDLVADQYEMCFVTTYRADEEGAFPEVVGEWWICAAGWT